MTQEEANDVLDELLALDSGLSAWEMDFLESLDRQRDRGFSDRQIDVLVRLESKLLH